MTLKAADVAEIMRLVEESSFDELTLEIDGLKLSLRRGSAGTMLNGAAFDAPPVQVPVAKAPQPEAAPKAPVPAASDPNAQDVKAPLLGTFYRSPKPGAPPFVDVGATVEEDTVVAIIEVMKLMNTVRAGVRGVVTEIFATDGALVEYDEALLRVRKAG